VAVPPGDNTPGDNTATDTNTLTPEADLALMKTASPGPFAVGQDATFTLTVTNHGPSVEPEASLVDMLPAGVTFVSASVPPVSQSGLNLTFQLGSLGAGESTIVMVVVRIDQAGALVNQATVSGTAADLVSSNNSASATITVTATETPPTVVLLQRFGFHEQPTAFVLKFSSALDPTRAQDPNNYTLRAVSPNGHLGKSFRIVSAVYNPLANTVTLHPATRLYLFRRYKLVVNGTPPAGLTGPSGVFLDGRGNGTPGSDHVKTFGPGLLAGSYFRVTHQVQQKARHVPSASSHASTTHLQSPRAASARPIARTQVPTPNGGSIWLKENAVDAVLGTLVSPSEVHIRFRTRSRSEN
jgi:uncharacterized repeat protein (TIGR01451 family)